MPVVADSIRSLAADAEETLDVRPVESGSPPPGSRTERADIHPYPETDAPMRVNPDYTEKLKETVKESPYPRHMAMVLEEIEIDLAVIVLRLADFHLQPFGLVHGGVLATVIDTATFWAAFLRLPEGTGLVNVDLKLNYLRPVVEGRLTARGRCLRAGSVISYSEAGVYDRNDSLVAHGTSTLMALPGKGLHLGMPKFLPA